MTIYKSFSKDLTNRDIEMLSGTITEPSWERLKPYLEQAIKLKSTEELKGIAINEFGIKFYINTRKYGI